MGFGLTSLTSVTLPDGIIIINDSVFQGCRSLASVYIPNSVQSIGDDAFSGCIRLTSVKIPNSVTSIGYYAFYNCDNLTEINVDGGNSVYSSLGGVVYDKDKTTLVLCPVGKDNVTIPDIKDFALYT